MFFRMIQEIFRRKAKLILKLRYRKKDKSVLNKDFWLLKIKLSLPNITKKIWGQELMIKI